MPIESKNLHYAFNVEYFTEALRSTDDKVADSLNQAILDLANRKERDNLLKSARAITDRLGELPNMQQMRFRVSWPGLMMGTGYPHELGLLKGEIQMGFTFDYVTGMPYYPGSSVKGVLRNAFNRAFPKKQSHTSKDMREAYKEYLKEKLEEVTKDRKSELGDITPDDVEIVFRWSFEGEKAEGKNLPITKRDVFYDAYIVGFAKEEQWAVLEQDNLTPHIDVKTGDPDPTREPTPITMLRVAPETVLCFSMRLYDVHRADGVLLLTAEEKKRLYRSLLVDFGVGAKTNVGYGSLEFYEGALHDPVAAPALDPRRNGQSSGWRQGEQTQGYGRRGSSPGARHEGSRHGERLNDQSRGGQGGARVHNSDRGRQR